MSDEKMHTVHIFINEAGYQSPSDTTGEALYALGSVPAGLELFREVIGDQVDPPVPRGADAVHVSENDHFHIGRPEFTIVVNGRKKLVAKRRLSFDRVVALAFDPVPTGPDVMFTITYRHGPKQNPEGTLTQGGTVKIKDGMIFNVTTTDKS
jgi:Multiubiquitin